MSATWIRFIIKILLTQFRPCIFQIRVLLTCSKWVCFDTLCGYVLEYFLTKCSKRFCWSCRRTKRKYSYFVAIWFISKTWSCSPLTMDLYTLDCRLRAVCKKQCFFSSSFFRALAVFTDRPHPVCPFGIADWLNRLHWVFISYLQRVPMPLMISSVTKYWPSWTVNQIFTCDLKTCVSCTLIWPTRLTDWT